MAAQELVLDDDDYFSFAARRTDDFAETDEFSAMRFHVTASLAGRTFEEFVIDIGFSDQLSWSPETIQTTDLLSFAGIAPIDLPAVPIAQHLAEKVHAYTRTYGADGRRSSRPKDLVDILLIEGAVALDADLLTAALERTFADRGRHRLPQKLPAPPPEWAAPYRRLADQVGIEGDVMLGFARAAALLDPLLGKSAVGQWDTRSGRWIASSGAVDGAYSGGHRR